MTGFTTLDGQLVVLGESTLADATTEGLKVNGTLTANTGDINLSTLTVDGLTKLNGNVGIGRSDPQDKLVIEDSTSVRAAIYSLMGWQSSTEYQNNSGHVLIGLEGSVGNQILSDSTAYGAIFGSVNNYDLQLGTNDTVRMSITAAGEIYFSSALRSAAGDSDMRFNTSTYEVTYDASARKFKMNIRKNPNTDFIHKIPIKVYDRKDGSKIDEIGIVAEDLEKVDPSYCCYDREGSIVAYNKSDLVPSMIAEIQKLRKEINELKI